MNKFLGFLLLVFGSFACLAMFMTLLPAETLGEVGAYVEVQHPEGELGDSLDDEASVTDSPKAPPLLSQPNREVLETANPTEGDQEAGAGGQEESDEL